ncbi:uncharacterized protein LOC127874094 [Dreissena polymorpha]|uniref:Macro domain-containing protein n=1 Tax=Dreissena polymorpha TaxID=45954 RepID=A0A9D4R0L9_DREPO|nr:uncharacterized protein LOC127874094 [Dreissena polymorpha]XP_052274183.1 uncharacterized protein LOC127874094 [Dreissena polymorpha]XP_052274185.1 uncharacterized protein LOC127874094 [Dreissena polymorpha]KAH3848940.1 hypothetical protein DPMN_091325 [Dreissena polymorpha]
MSGIHVSRLPSNVSDKQIQVYFGNPRNGGGRVTKVLHPLPRSSAVVLFEDEAVVSQLLGSQHRMMNQELEVTRLPKSVFSRVQADVDPHVSAFMRQNGQLIDELQFIGDVSVEPSGGGQTYVITGTWHQLEWALHYLNTAVDAMGFTEPMVCGTNIPSSEPRAEQITSEGPSASSKSFEIARPNFPILKRPADTERPEVVDQATGHPPESHVKRHKNKNKNYPPKNVTGSEERVSSGTGSRRIIDSTLRSNLNDDSQANDDFVIRQNDLNAFGSSGPFGSIGDDETLGQRLARELSGVEGLKQLQDAFLAGLGLPFDSDSSSDNDSDTSGRHVSFHPDTMFDQRPLPRDIPEMTRGIDVCNLGAANEATLSYSFKMTDTLSVLVAKDDITTQTTNAIVNPTTRNLSCMTGVSRAIMTSGGQDLQMECRRQVDKHGELDVTQVVHTAAGGKLNPNVAFVVHAFGPSWRETESERSTHLLVCTYLNCLIYADKTLWAKSLSTPLISAGPYGFPVDVCVSAFYDALLLYVDNVGTSARLATINLICYDADTAGAAIMIVQSLRDCDTTQAAAAAMDRYTIRKLNFDVAAELLETTMPITDDHNDEFMDYDDDEIDVNNTLKAMKQREQVKANITDDGKEVNASGIIRAVKVDTKFQNLDGGSDANVPRVDDQRKCKATDDDREKVNRVVDESEDSDDDNEHTCVIDKDLEKVEYCSNKVGAEGKEQETEGLPEEIEEGMQEMNIDDDKDNDDGKDNDKDIDDQKDQAVVVTSKAEEIAEGEDVKLEAVVVTIKAEEIAEDEAVKHEKKDTPIASGIVDYATHTPCDEEEII